MMTENTIQVSGYTITIQGGTSGFNLELKASDVAEGVTDVCFSFTASSPVQPVPVILSWNHPLVSTHLIWHPGAMLDRTITPDWAPRYFISRNTTHSPICTLCDIKGVNRLTFAISDAMNAIGLSVGAVEETAQAQCQVILFPEPMSAIERYTVTLRLDTRAISYERVLSAVSTWWESLVGLQPSLLPRDASVPLYSTWYSFHQNLTADTVEEQCKLAKTLGMDLLIVDDGWQTDDINRGYSYCGDWEVAQNKFPDFAAHVARIHAIGLKYVLWFSVPFLGVNTKVYQRFKDKVLDPNSTHGWYVLDPRFPEVRAYLLEVYQRFILDYDIDGFKLDFVDSFSLAQPSEGLNEGRDYDSVSAAVDRLLTDIMNTLRRLKPGILIEFRQRYVGPLMRKYGNMLRAGDSPDDLTQNRVRTLDVRLLAGKTPVHADMFMWHSDEPVESAAMHFVHSLFAVPQISVLLDKIPPSHVEMLRFYIDFWREQRDVLLDGSLQPQGLGYLYPLVIASTASKCLVAFYGTTIVRLSDIPATLIMVNGTFDEQIVLDFIGQPWQGTLTIQSCVGKVIQTQFVEIDRGIHCFSVPPAGVVTIETT